DEPDDRTRDRADRGSLRTDARGRRPGGFRAILCRCPRDAGRRSLGTAAHRDVAGTRWRRFPGTVAGRDRRRRCDPPGPWRVACPLRPPGAAGHAGRDGGAVGAGGVRDGVAAFRAGQCGTLRHGPRWQRRRTDRAGHALGRPARPGL
ncbi:MAG: hypothetical protein AVDCRST_MAG33-521, partial [uncultured Thermomicrobiales bacterium]